MSMHASLNAATKTQALSTAGGIASKNLKFLNTDKDISPHTSEYGNNRLCFNMSHWKKVCDNGKKT